MVASIHIRRQHPISTSYDLHKTPPAPTQHLHPNHNPRPFQIHPVPNIPAPFNNNNLHPPNPPPNMPHPNPPPNPPPKPPPPPKKRLEPPNPRPPPHKSPRPPLTPFSNLHQMPQPPTHHLRFSNLRRPTRTRKKFREFGERVSIFESCQDLWTEWEYAFTCECFACFVWEL